ncbi:MAG: family 16 glycosylhydrolase [Thalassotalea sp.]
MNTYKLALLLAAIGAVGQNVYANIPNGFEAGQLRWQLKGNRSDEFNGQALDEKKWESAPKSLVVGAWTFDQNNSYVQDGKLNIKVTQETHSRQFPDICQGGKKVDREIYYKSGAVKSFADGVYGFYEARMKGVKIFPGLSPAFWLFSDGHPYSDRNIEGSVDYSEIDIVELQQADWHGPGKDDADAINVMDHNLHARVIGKNGKVQWRRPKPFPEAQLLRYDAPFDPSEGFHTYAVENRKDKISWYVDGKLIGEKPNLFWHRPMHVIFSMGLRRQFINYNAQCQRADPNPSQVTSEGFPENATMQVDYIKTWQALPSMWLDNRQALQQNQYQTSEDLKLQLSYHGGSNDHVVLAKHRGIKVNLLEKNKDGLVRVVRSVNDESAALEAHKYAGKLNVSIPLAGVMPSHKLALGHYYAVNAVFTSSNGKDIFLAKPVENIIVK